MYSLKDTLETFDQEIWRAIEHEYSARKSTSS